MGDVIEMRPPAWHALEMDLLDMLALARALRAWLSVPSPWPDGEARGAALAEVGAVATALGLAVAESCPKLQQDYLLVASGRAVMLRGSVMGLEASELLAEWQERIEDLCDALEMAGLQRFTLMERPAGGEIVPW
ncbi:MAG: hypothetical protein GY898_06720 [Proteobacteria bacterium]|nr:hypothetical protein [Pseudomonadota bacterium]